jgi:hypothetical protein
MALAAPALALAAAAGARAAEILRDGSYQLSLPPAPDAPSALPPGVLDLVLRALLWTAFAAVVVVAVGWVARRLGLGARDVGLAAASPAAPAAPAPLRVDGAEALAAEGRFAEAIHALLLDTLEALSRAARLAPSLTSREIVARVRLAPRARDALAGLVDAVEITWFGGAVPSEADYRRCLERFHAFRDTYRSAA